VPPVAARGQRQGAADGHSATGSLRRRGATGNAAEVVRDDPVTAGGRLLADVAWAEVRSLLDQLEREVDAGHYRPPEAPELIADAIVSLGERYLYHANAGFAAA
jgi:hypothetical protein